jgi:hypothetical protein
VNELSLAQLLRLLKDVIRRNNHRPSRAGDCHFEIYLAGFLNAIWLKLAAVSAWPRQAAPGLVRQTTNERSSLECPETP